MELKLNTLRVGQRVAVARYGSWHVSSQGVYIVAKANKMQVVLKREGDGYERTWSVKTGKERGYDGKFSDRSSFVETVEAMEARNLKRQYEAMINGLWRDAESAVNRKNLADLKELVAKLEAEVK